MLFRFHIALLAGLSAAIVSAAPPAIGIVTASGHFILEHSQVWGNSTLFDGSTVETTGASSELILNSGARLQLGAASRARVWQNHVALEKGIGQVSGSSAYAVEVRGLRILPVRPSSRVRVGVPDAQRVQVVALVGNALVMDSSGAVVAAVAPGRTFLFQPQAAGTSLTRSGCIVYKDGKFLLQDEKTGEVVELQGSNLARYVGNRIEVTGTVAAAGPSVQVARMVVKVNSVTPGPTGGCLTTAAELGAQTSVPSGVSQASAGTPTPAPVHHGMSAGAKAGIAIAVAGGGAGAAIALSQKKKSTSP